MSLSRMVGNTPLSRTMMLVFKYSTFRTRLPRQLLPATTQRDLQEESSFVSDGQHAYVADARSGLQVIDVKAKPHGSVATPRWEHRYRP